MARIEFNFGLNETEATQPTEAKEGFNFELELAAKRLFPRKPFDLKGTLPNTGSVNGIIQLIKRDDSETTCIFEAGVTTPTLYLWTGANTTTAFTSVRTTNLDSTSMFRDTHWDLDEEMVITDLRKLTPLLNWDGTEMTRQKTNLGAGNALTNTGISESSGTYTVLTAAHTYAVGDTVIVAGTDVSALNAEHEVTNVVSAGAWDFEATPGSGSTSTHGTSEETTPLYAKYAVVHAGRLWLFNITTGSDPNPHMILASKFEDHESFDTVNRNGIATGNEAFYTLTPDLKPINGVSLFNKQVIISTVDGRLHRLSGLDAADYQFTTYFAGSAAIGEESMANIGNDMIYVRDGGNIDLFQATDTSGDVRADDVSRWIPDTVHDITGSITIYDQQHQKVWFFLSNKVLVLFKDVFATGGGSPWSIYKTELLDGNNTSIFDTKAVRYMRRPGETTKAIYLGDQTGKIYDLTGSGTGDNSLDIAVSRKTMLLESERAPIMRGSIQYRRLGEMSCTLTFDWANEYNLTQADITLKGPPASEGDPTYYNGAFYYNESDNFYNEGFAFAEKVSKQNFAPAGRADAFFLTFYSETTVQFQVDMIRLLE